MTVEINNPVLLQDGESLLTELVRIHSPSGQERRAVMHLVDWFSRHGFAAHRDAFVPIRDGVALREEFLRTGGVPAGYPRFAPIVYAADSMLPIINLGQKDYWAPLAGSPPAWFTPFRLLHTALGWFLTTIFVAGVSGLIRRD